MNSYDDCISKGLLRKVQPSVDRAKRTITKAEKWLEKARRLLEVEEWDGCLIFSYLGMFQASKSILIKDGWREKSHFCVARYLDKQYVSTGRLEAVWVQLLDRARELRHADQYDLDFSATKTDAEKMLSDAEDFVHRIRKLLL